MPSVEAEMPDRPAPRPRFELGCGQVVLIGILAVAAVGLRLAYVARKEKAIRAVQHLGGSVVRGKEVFVPECLRPLFPSHAVVADLANTQASNADVERLTPLTRLERLRLDRTQITPGGLGPVARLKRLTSLSLDHTAIADDDLAQLGSLQGLAALSLADTRIGDRGLAHLRACCGLQTLTLTGTQVTDTGLAALRELPALAHLWLDEAHITPAGAAQLRAFPSLQVLVVHVPRGFGKRAWELLAPAKTIHATGVRRGAGYLLWDNAVPWHDSAAGLAELLLAHADLGPELEEDVIQAIAANKTSRLTLWFGPPPLFRFPALSDLSEEDGIRTVDQLIDSLWQPGLKSFVRARLFASRSDAHAAVPALLKVLDQGKQSEGDYWAHYRAVFLVVRIAGADPRVSAALDRALNSQDARLREMTLRGLDEGPVADSAGPKLPPELAEAYTDFAARALDDASPWVRRAAVQVAANLVVVAPRQAPAAVLRLAELLWDADPGVRFEAAVGLGRIAQVRPELAETAVRRVIGLWEQEEGRVTDGMIRALALVAPHREPAARAAFAMLLDLVGDLPQSERSSSETLPIRQTYSPSRESAERLARAAGEALGWIAKSYPGDVPALLKAIAPKLRHDNRRVRSAASHALLAIAVGLRDANRRAPLSARDPNTRRATTPSGNQD